MAGFSDSRRIMVSKWTRPNKNGSSSRQIEKLTTPTNRWLFFATLSDDLSPTAITCDLSRLIVERVILQIRTTNRDSPGVVRCFFCFMAFWLGWCFVLLPREKDARIGKKLRQIGVRTEAVQAGRLQPPRQRHEQFCKRQQPTAKSAAEAATMIGTAPRKAPTHKLLSETITEKKPGSHGVEASRRPPIWASERGAAATH